MILFYLVACLSTQSHRSGKMRITNASRSTWHALSNCVHARTSHFRTQLAIPYHATEASVGLLKNSKSHLLLKKGFSNRTLKGL